MTDLRNCRLGIPVCLAALIVFSGSNIAAGDELQLADDIATFDDGRASIQALFSEYGRLLDKGWKLDVIVHSQPHDTTYPIPVIALRTARSGPAIWIIAGIHGEEPAGPNAIAAVIDELSALGEEHPVVIVPLANPHGYVRNWRYLNSRVWTENADVQSVGDSSHVLPDPDTPREARAPGASSPEADAITRYIIDRMPGYPPLTSIDLHEDDKILEGYIYSQGIDGADDPLAAEAVRVLRDHLIPVKLDGHTRFGEDIVDGVVGPVTDSSIDEFMSATQIIVGGARIPGPSAQTVLVFETPAGILPLPRRITAHAALLQRIMKLHAAAHE